MSSFYLWSSSCYCCCYRHCGCYQAKSQSLRVSAFSFGGVWQLKSWHWVLLLGLLYFSHLLWQRLWASRYFFVDFLSPNDLVEYLWLIFPRFFQDLFFHYLRLLEQEFWHFQHRYWPLSCSYHRHHHRLHCFLRLRNHWHWKRTTNLFYYFITERLCGGLWSFLLIQCLEVRFWIKHQLGLLFVWSWDRLKFCVVCCSTRKPLLWGRSSIYFGGQPAVFVLDPFSFCCSRRLWQLVCQLQWR